MAEEKDYKEENYKRMLFAIAVLFANKLGVNINSQTSFEDLTDTQKAYASKVLKENPSIEKHVE